MIIVRNVTFDYPTVRAVDDVSLSVEEATITALVGPNGAGKTTLLRCIAGLEKPFSGSVAVNGIDVVREPRKSHRCVGFLPDFFGLYDDLTVRRCLEFFAASGARDGGVVPSAVEGAARRLWLHDRLDTPVKALSRGMRQRLAIAQMIVKKPKVLLLDEPASGLDPGARSELSDLFRQLKAEGVTLVVSSHILTELEQYADRLVIMNKGRVLSDGTVNSAAAPLTRVSVALLSDTKEFITVAGDSNVVKRTEKEGDRVMVHIAGGQQEAADVLKMAIDSGCRICEFRILGADMQSEYMRVVAQCKGAADE